MQGVAALHEKFIVEDTDFIKSLVLELAGDSKNWNDMLGDQAASLRAYLEDSNGLTHATFKDSQVFACHVILTLPSSLFRQDVPPQLEL